MHSWAQRGLRIALVTGGLFMLGSGIASAQGAVDLPAPVGHVTGAAATAKAEELAKVRELAAATDHTTAPVTRAALARTQGLPLPLPTSMGLPSIEDLGVLDSVLGGGLGSGLGGGTSN